jgi:hypothetical protein
MSANRSEEYLYHRVPGNMFGAVLYPLNALKESHPDIYAEHIKKYKGREKLLSAEIPPLHCLWNDVLHFTAVSPQELKNNLAKAGIELDPVAWYKVPVSMIKGEKSITFIYRRDTGLIPTFKEFEPFDPSKMSTYRKVPEETIEYYRQKHAEGVRPLLFHLVPHILYKGNIETKDLEIITA